MSVRRLADEAVQPEKFAFTKANAAWARETIRKYPEGRQHSAVIPLLMRAQEQEGWVTQKAVERVAEMLDMPLIRVLEVATFYTQFQLAPVGKRAHVQVCGTTPCMLRGAEGLVEVCKKKIHSQPFHTNESGTLSWEEVECQGACVNAPMVMISRDTYEDLTPERLEEIIDAFDAGKGEEIEPGPQIDRIYAAPAAGLTSLRDETAVLKSQPKGRRRKGKADGPHVPPSRAAKPETYARETDESIASPSDVKSSNNGEKAASAEPPKEDTAQADRVSEETERSTKERRHSDAHPTHSHRAGATASIAKTAKGVTPGKRPRRTSAAGDENPTMALARTARGTPKPASTGTRPEGIRRPAKPDDLKMISGVGPKIEGILNDLGIYTYAQIAGWKKAERQWVDDHLRFKGRIEREDWVKQAKALARGGAAEYERVFGRKPR